MAKREFYGATRTLCLLARTGGSHATERRGDGMDLDSSVEAPKRRDACGLPFMLPHPSAKLGTGYRRERPEAGFRMNAPNGALLQSWGQATTIAPAAGALHEPLVGHRFVSVRGFTLVELVVVMAIILLASLLVMVNARPVSRNRAAETPPVVEYLRQQQALAVKKGKSLCIHVSAGADRLQAVPDGGTYAFRPGEELRLIDPPYPASGNSPPSICFYPDGLPTESRWKLTANNTNYTITVSPFAAEIGFSAEPPG